MTDEFWIIAYVIALIVVVFVAVYFTNRAIETTKCPNCGKRVKIDKILGLMKFDGGVIDYCSHCKDEVENAEAAREYDAYMKKDFEKAFTELIKDDNK